MQRKYWLFAVLTYVLVLGLGLYALLLERQPQDTPPPTAQEEQPLFSYSIRYSCKHDVTLANQDGLASLLSMLNLEENAISWEASVVASAETQDIVHVGVVNELCRECQTYLFVGVKDGYVAVYYGLPREGAVLKYKTDIPVSRLPLDMQRDLERGVFMRTEGDLQRFLEGIDR